MAEVYGNLVIVVILVMEGVSKAALCPSTMHHRHALYDSRRVTERRSCTQQARLHMQCKAACMSLTEALCLSVTSTGKVSSWVISEFPLSIG